VRAAATTPRTSAPGTAATAAAPDAPAGAGPVQRLAALVAALGALVAAYTWLSPLTVPANRGLPFGCGAPFRPNDVGLAGQVCSAGLDGRRSAAVAALVVALVGVLVAVLLQLATGAVGRSLTRLGLGLLVAAPLAAAAAVVLLSPLQVRSADGATVVSCGRAAAPTVDPFAAGLCADVPGETRGQGLALAGAAVLLGIGVPVVASARARPVAPTGKA
jgi:hypothetical protein